MVDPPVGSAGLAARLVWNPLRNECPVSRVTHANNMQEKGVFLARDQLILFVARLTRLRSKNGYNSRPFALAYQPPGMLRRATDHEDRFRILRRKEKPSLEN
jgi:hypothetical protein